MDEGDIIIDAGNSLFTDTIRREHDLRCGLHFVSCGVSGGEEAPCGPVDHARRLAEPTKHLGPMLERSQRRLTVNHAVLTLARAVPGAVKMVHNGIEYADMQVIGQAHDLRVARSASRLRNRGYFRAGMRATGLHLMEITVEVLRQVDQKPASRWLTSSLTLPAGRARVRTTQTALSLAPVTGIGGQRSRAVSSSPKQREAARGFAGEAAEWNIEDREAFIEDVRQAL